MNSRQVALRRGVKEQGLAQKCYLISPEVKDIFKTLIS